MFVLQGFINAKLLLLLKKHHLIILFYNMKDIIGQDTEFRQCMQQMMNASRLTGCWQRSQSFLTSFKSRSRYTVWMKNTGLRKHPSRHESSRLPGTNMYLLKHLTSTVPWKHQGQQLSNVPHLSRCKSKTRLIRQQIKVWPRVVVVQSLVHLYSFKTIMAAVSRHRIWTQQGFVMVLNQHLSNTSAKAPLVDPFRNV